MKIFLAGDSFGLGEFRYGGGLRTHGGLAQYLKEHGYVVFNTSKGGSSSGEALTRLQSAITVHYEPGDLVLFIISDPIRELRPYSENLTQAVIEAGSITAASLKMFYKICASIDQQPWKTHLIGGVCSYTPDMVQDYPNIVPLVPSWSDLLVGHLPFYEPYKNKYWSAAQGWRNGLVDIALIEKQNPELARQVVDEMRQLNARAKNVFKEDIFHPDGKHPNKTGHLWLFNYIVEKLNLPPVDNLVKPLYN